MSPLFCKRLSDESLGSRLASGEAAAFDELYRRYVNRLAAYGSHLLLDWLGTDTAPPRGIMALWPFTDAYYIAPISILLPVPHNVLTRSFWTMTPLAAVTELLIFGPIVYLVARSRTG